MAKGCLNSDVNRCGGSGSPLSAFSFRQGGKSHALSSKSASEQRFRSVRFCLFLLLVAATGTPGSLLGQGASLDTNSITVLQTGSGQPLSTFSQTISASGAGTSPMLHFSFGFSTDETSAPSTFLDSASLTLQNAQNDSAIFFTVDLNGVNWAPATPGNIQLNPAGWTLTPITFPGLLPNQQTKFAYEVTAPLPAAFLGQELNFHFDLFDNQNALGSMAWITPIAVPEPGSLVLGFFTLLVFAFLKRSRF
jgi:hypothetical protein